MDHIIIMVKFREYASMGSSKNVPNDVRRFLVGTYQSETPGLPDKINEEVGNEVIIPIAFSLIKRPIKLPGAKRLINKAIGAIAIYKYFGPPEELNQVCLKIFEACNKRLKNKRYGKSDFTIFIAKEVEYHGGQ